MHRRNTCQRRAACYARHMDETRYHALADATLAHCFKQLEAAYEHGTLDELELQGGILTMRAASGRVYLLSKHAPSQQLWLASPVSGGLHFSSHGNDAPAWQLPDGTPLFTLLRRELAAEQIEVVL